jgi:hypothetical protein
MALACAPFRSLLAALLLAALALAPATARAQAANPAEVEDLIRQGNDLRRAGKDPAAVPIFQKAYDLERSARTAAQLGLVEAQMGYWVAAERHLTEALSFTRHPWLDRNRAVVEETLKRVQSYIGELVVTGSPAGAEVLVNGKSAGKPAARQAGARGGGPGAGGPARARPLARQHHRHGRRRQARPGEPGPETGGRSRPRNHVRPDAGPRTRHRLPGAAGRDAGADASTSASAASAGWVRPVAWVATAGAVLAASVGTYGILSQRAARQDFDEYVNPGATTPSCFTAGSDKGGPKCREYYNRAESARKVAIGGFVAGGALARGRSSASCCPRARASGWPTPRHGWPWRQRRLDPAVLTDRAAVIAAVQPHGPCHLPSGISRLAALPWTKMTHRLDRRRHPPPKQ